MPSGKWVVSRVFSVDAALLALRLLLFAVFLHHGGQKMLGWFGGDGWSTTVENFGIGLKIPPSLAAVAIVTEFVGAWCILAGFLARFWSAGLAINMLVAIFYVHMHLQGKAAAELEFQFSLLAASLAVFLAGPGRCALMDIEGHLLGVGLPMGE